MAMAIVHVSVQKYVIGLKITGTTDHVIIQQHTSVKKASLIEVWKI